MKSLKNSTKDNIKTIVSLFVFSVTIFFMACSDDDNGTVPEPEPKLTPILSGISPTSGPKATDVIISGANFGTDKSAVSVFFNEIEAEVQSVANDKISALVPPRAFTGTVKVMINSTTLTGPEFIYVISDIQVSTLAGSTQGFVDGTGATARFYSPNGIAIDAEGIVYVADRSNNKIRKITSEGDVSTLAGSTAGFAEGTGANAKFNAPIGVAVDVEGTVYVTDAANHKIRKITPEGVVSTLAGSTQGLADGPGATAQFNTPYGVAVDPQGILYVADTGNHRIRKVTSEGVVSTLAGNIQGFAEGTGTNAQFNTPRRVEVDAQGTVYVADESNSRIRKITPEGVVSTLAGSTQGLAEGTGTNAQFSLPRGVTVNAQGTIYVADASNHRIRKITPEGVVSTLAGSTEGFGDGTGADAQFSVPLGVAVSAQGIIYVTDALNHRIRKITQE